MTNTVTPTPPLSIVPDFKEILSEVIKKQMTTLGPDITIAKVKSIPGVVISDDGTVTEVAGEPKQIAKSLEEAFTELAGSIVKKTMEPLIAFNEGQNMQPSQTIPTQLTEAPTTSSMPSPTPIMPTETADPISSVGTTDSSTPAPTTPTPTPMPSMTPEEPKTDPSPIMQDSTTMPTPQPQTPSESNPISTPTAPTPIPQMPDQPQNSMPSAQTETSTSPFATPSAPSPTPNPAENTEAPKPS